MKAGLIEYFSSLPAPCFGNIKIYLVTEIILLIITGSQKNVTDHVKLIHLVLFVSFYASNLC